jgi:hypothetical protein
MKDLKDIEQKLRGGRLPDSDMTHRHSFVWRKIIDTQRVKRREFLPFGGSPWVWALGSLIVILLFLIFIFMSK